MISSLDNKQSATFVVVVQTGSFDGASKQLCITPSAVSLRIQALEEELGCRLLQRTRPCIMTSAGQKLFEYLRTTHRLQQDLFENLAGISNQSLQKIVIASNADSLATWLLSTIKQTLITHNIVTEIQLDDQAQTHHLLNSGSVNACISAESKALQGCQSIYLGSMCYQLVATRNFIKKWFTPKLPNHQSHDASTMIGRQSLEHAPAVIFNEKDELHFDYLEQNFGLRKDTYPYHTVPSSDAFLSAIELGLGYGFVPELQLVNKLQVNKHQNQLILLSANIEVPLYWHHWKQQSKALEILTQTIINNSKIHLHS